MTLPPPARHIVFRQIWQGQGLSVVDQGEYRSLYFDSPLIQSRMNLNHPQQLVSPYLRHMLAGLLFNTHPERVLMIGVGGGSLAKFFLRHFPECRVEGVDCHPAMATIAHRFFFLPQESRLTLHCAEAIPFVAARSPLPLRHDWILVDAFDHAGLSSQVGSADFLSNLGTLLSDEGVLIFNLFRSQAAVYRQVVRQLVAGFPRAIFRLPVASGNEIVFCFHQAHPLKNLKKLPELQRMTQTWSDQPQLTFNDFLGYLHRLVPVKQTLLRYSLRERIQFYLDLENEIRVY